MMAVEQNPAYEPVAFFSHFNFLNKGKSKSFTMWQLWNC